MPTYQYACTECGDRLEVVQRFSDDPLTVCAVCGGKLRKVYSPVGIVFKGSGFYRTDSRSGSVTSGSSNGKSEGSSGSDSKADSGKGADSGSSGTKAGSDSSSSSNGSSSGGDGSKSSTTSAGTGTGSKVA